VKTRRGFLARLAMAGAVAGTWTVATRAGQLPQSPQPPRATQDKSTDSTADSPNVPSQEKRLLEDNEKDIKKKVEKLYELASELKTEVDKTDSSKVLSVALLKKTEEIEKLARDIRNRSKG
jgi:hypothetical protein